MAWGLKQHPAQLTNITAEQYFASGVSLGISDRAHCQIAIGFPSNPVDAVIVSVYGTVDASSELWDSAPLASFAIYPGSPVVSFFVVGPYKFRVGVARNGSTDTIPTADLYYRTAVV